MPEEDEIHSLDVLIEKNREDTEALLALGDKLPAFIKVINEQGTSLSDSDIAKSLTIGLGDASDLSGALMGLYHWIYEHDMKAEQIGTELKKLGFDSANVDRLVSAFSALNDKGRRALEIFDIWLQSPRIASHWNRTWIRTDYRPIKREGKLEGLMPMVVFKLEVTDEHVEEHSELITFEMSILEFKGFMDTLVRARDIIEKETEEIRKSVGSLLIK
jgi:hypothetical protein